MTGTNKCNNSTNQKTILSTTSYCVLQVITWYAVIGRLSISILLQFLIWDHILIKLRVVYKIIVYYSISNIQQQSTGSNLQQIVNNFPENNLHFTIEVSC